jgi:putative transcriptional regulator
MTTAGKRLIKAAQEAAAIARGERKPASIHVPADVDVKAIRQGLKLSQEEFASEFGFTINQIRDWEQGRVRPTGASRAYLIVINSGPDIIRSILKNEMRKTKRRKAA